MTDDNHEPTEVSTNKTTPAVSSAATTVNGNGERMEVTSRRTYLKTFGLGGLLGAVGLTSPVASSRSLAAQSDALVDSDPHTAIRAAQFSTETKLTASDATSGDNFGSAVSVSGDGTTVLIGAVKDDEPSYGGAAYVYDLSGSSPSETELVADDADFQDRFGYTVSVSGDGTTALIGAPRDDGSGRASGAAYVYDLSGSTPTETKLTPSGVDFFDIFGRSVSVSDDGTTALVGAFGASDAARFAGAAYVYDLSGSSPTETKLTANDAAENDAYGIDVSVSDDGTTALIGASNDDDAGTNSGAAYVYDLSGSSPTETELIASDTTAGDSFGEAVSLNDDGTTALVGAPGNDDTGEGSGSAYVYNLSGSPPTETELTTSDVAGGFGGRVSMNDDGTTVLIGAAGDDDAGPYSNTGSAYVFTAESARTG